MKRILTAIAVVSLSACGKPSSTSNEPKVAKGNSITSVQWCRVDNLTEELQVVTRFSFQQNPDKVSLSLLRITDGGSPVVFNEETSYDWYQAKSGYTSGTRKAVELVEDRLEARTLASSTEQAMIFEKLLKTNRNLKISSDSLVPSKALRLKVRGFFDGKETERTLFPCSDYSETFLVREPARSIFEFNMFLGQSVWSQNSALLSDRLAWRMALQFPMEQVNTKDVVIEGSSWCSWYQSDENYFLAHTMTIGKDRYATSDVVSSVMDSDFDAGMRDVIDRARIHTINENQKTLRSTHDYDYGKTTIKINEVLIALRDSAGTDILFYDSPDLPGLMWQRGFSDIYFRCDDPRPLKLDAGFKKNMQKFLTLQKAKLNL